MPDDGRNLVISFPRSGLNWLRHCAEHIGGGRTPGHPHIFAEGPLLFDRTHDVRRVNNRSEFKALRTDDGKEAYRRVALLLRRPEECFVSHYLRKGLSFRKGLRAFDSFAINIVEFERLAAAEKAVFYYEDFIGKEEGTFRFLRFFGIDPSARSHDLSALVESSRLWYQNRHGLIEENKRPVLSPRQARAIHTLLQQHLGAACFVQYLGCYYQPAFRI